MPDDQPPTIQQTATGDHIYQAAQGSTIIVNEATAVGVVGLHQLPPPPRDFTGRAAELAELMAQPPICGAYRNAPYSLDRTPTSFLATATAPIASSL